MTPLQFSIRSGQQKLAKLMTDIQDIDLNMKGKFCENEPSNSKFYEG